MILFTLGTHRIPFPRLAALAHDVASETDETVLLQHGHTPPGDGPAECHGFAPDAEAFDAWNREARWVVGHAGVGTILGALRQGTPIIVVPRQAARKEHVDDHQGELAQALEAMGLIQVADDLATLRRLLATEPPEPPRIEPGRLARHLRTRIEAA